MSRWDTVPDGAFRGPQVCDLAGITYRQLDYWVRTGLLEPSVAYANGSGSQRLYSRSDIAVAKVIRGLVVDGRPHGSYATNRRLGLARGVAPIVRSLVEAGYGRDLVLVVTLDDVIPCTTDAELVDAVRGHEVTTVLTGFVLDPEHDVPQAVAS